MQLDERRAEPGVTQVTPQLLLPGESVATSSAPVNDAQQVLRRESRWRRVGSWLAANPKVAFGLGIVGFFVLVAILGPVIIRQSPTAFSSDVLQPPSTAHWLGTTQTGQDVFAQVVIGTRVSLAVGLGTGFLATIVSVIIGLTAGYFGGLIDDMLSLLINVFL